MYQGVTLAGMGREIKKNGSASLQTNKQKKMQKKF